MRNRYSDAELMEQVRDHGDPEAFGELTLRWRLRLAGYFRPLLVEPALVDDAVQDVLVRLWTDRDGYRATGRFSTWILAYARHHWLNLRRRERRRETEALDDELAGDTAGNGTEAAALARLDRDGLTRAAAALPDGQRAVLDLVAVQGLPEREVARRLGLPLGTVKSRLHAARRGLRRELSEPARREERDA